MSIKEIVTVPLDALLLHPNEDIKKLASELLAKLVVYYLEKDK